LGLRQGEKNTENWKNIQLEESVGDLKHKDVGMTVIMHDENTLDRASHAKVLIVILEAL